jgi:hypothetical protein
LCTPRWTSLESTGRVVVVIERVLDKRLCLEVNMRGTKEARIVVRRPPTNTNTTQEEFAA